MRLSRPPIVLAIVAMTSYLGFAEQQAAKQLIDAYSESVQPLMQRFCFECHGEVVQEAKLDLSRFVTLDHVIAGIQTWELVLQRIEAGEMPPDDAQPQPTDAQRQRLVDWIRAFRRHEAHRTAGDPGPVAARRLSNEEYNYTIRDLTKQDIKPAREFPVDPANESGFDNSSESLSMSPALLTKYLGAAREVVDHLILQPDGFAFAPHPVVTDTDRDKYCVARIIDFYHRQPIDYADYFLAAWKHQHRIAFGTPTITISEQAKLNAVSPKYLATVWEILTGTVNDLGPIAQLRNAWRKLPVLEGNSSSSDVVSMFARQECEQLRNWVKDLRSRLVPKFEKLSVKQIQNGSQTMVLWRNRQYAAHRRTGDLSQLLVEDNFVIPSEPAERAVYEAAFQRFCSIFPDTFFVSERGRDYADNAKNEQEKGRLLGAGFHNMMGYFRDDAPLVELILDAQQKQELDTFWKELDFVASAPLRQYTGFVWFERAETNFLRDEEFDFARSEDKDVTTEAKIDRLSKAYLAKAIRGGANEIGIKAIEDYFKDMNTSIRWVEQARLAAEPSHLEALMEFTERAYRRPLLTAEREDLLSYYQTLRSREGLRHEEALQDAIVYVLMSPQFCYRMDLANAEDVSRPLTDFELANRLSYFLWSSMPDQELLDSAANGQLQQPGVLVNQARRMLLDKRVRGLVTEFGGNWLDFRRFEEHNSVDRERFPNFTDVLRKAMFEEPVRFFEDLIIEGRSVLDFLYAKHTFVNLTLAEHYGLTGLELEGNQWIKVVDADKVARGGLLPMSVFLTQNSPGLRTSPVKRGYWVTRRLLGEKIPPPPPNVPELPSDESKLGELTLRETLSLHREHKSCSGCHDRFDAIGLVFESYGPIGQRRSEDLGGRSVDTQALFPDGKERVGFEGLQAYIREQRQTDFLNNLCRKLLSYALGRSLQLSDEPTLDVMHRKLASDSYRFRSLVETIITTPQFLSKRGRAPIAKGVSEPR